MKNIFSPVLKQEIMISGTGFLAVAAREAAIKARAEAQAEAQVQAQVEAIKVAKKAKLEANTLTVMRGWHREAPLDLIADMVDLSPNQVTQLIATFEKVKTYCLSKTEIDMKELKQLSGLSNTELKVLLVLLHQKK